jgi:hypothetical protein
MTHERAYFCCILILTERPSKVAKQNHAIASGEPVTIPESVVVVDPTAAASKESHADGGRSGIDTMTSAASKKLSVVLPATQKQTRARLSVVSPEVVPLPPSMRDEAAGVDVLVSVCWK